MNRSAFPTEIPIIGRVRICLEILRRQDLYGKTVVDLGCSFGWLERELVRDKAKLIGIDSDKEAISFAQKILRRKAEFIFGDALEMPLEKNIADIVVFFDVIEHLPQDSEKKSIREIHRVLKKGGLLFLTTPNDHFLINLLDPVWYFGHRHYEASYLKRLLRTEGFKIIHHSIRGNFLNPIYAIWFYATKFFLRKKQPRNRFLEAISDYGYNIEGGIYEHFILGRKI